MIREPVVIIQPGRNASRLGNRRVKEFPNISLLFTSLGDVLLGCIPSLRLEILDGFVLGAVGGKKRRKSGYVEHFSDRIRATIESVVGNCFLKPAQHNLAVNTVEALARNGKHAQARAADIIELPQIDDEAAVARFNLAENLFLKCLGSVPSSFPDRLRVTMSAVRFSVISMESSPPSSFIIYHHRKIFPVLASIFQFLWIDSRAKIGWVEAFCAETSSQHLNATNVESVDPVMSKVSDIALGDDDEV